MQKLIGSALAGLSATFLMEYASSFIYERQDETTREREEQLREAMPTTVLVRKVAGLAGRELDEERAGKLGMAAHYAFGASGGPVALALRKCGLSSLAAGSAVAGAMTVTVDEGLNYVLGLTPPPGAFPAVAHLRGLLAHAAYGVGLGLLLAAGDERR